MKVYGISNCDTVKKARAWLDAHHVAYEFHDYKKHGVDEKLLRAWLKKTSWETLVNRQGQTWRKLSETEKAQIQNAASALRLMLDKPSIIKRPALEVDGKLILGFDPTHYAQLFGDAT